MFKIRIWKMCIRDRAQFMQQQGYQVITASGGPFPKEGIAQLKGVRFIPQPHLVRPISIKEDLLALRDMIRLIRKERPDIIHSHTPKAGLMGMLAGWLCRVPILSLIHIYSPCLLVKRRRPPSLCYSI